MNKKRQNELQEIEKKKIRFFTPKAVIISTINNLMQMNID